MNDFEKFKSEYHDFLSTAPMPPSTLMSSQLTSKINKMLSPTVESVAIKSSSIFLIVALFTLLFCPQFGVGRDAGVLNVFMSLGHTGCLFACGAFFLGMGAVGSLICLSKEELRVINSLRYFIPPIHAAIGLLLILLLGGSLPFRSLPYWLIGSLLSSYFVFFSWLSREPA